MGWSQIHTVGKSFSSEYQPARRGRPKGSLNSRTILRLYFEQFERAERTPTEQVCEWLDAVLGKRRARPAKRRLRKDEEKRARRRKPKPPPDPWALL